MKYKHIKDCWNALEGAKTYKEVLELCESFPRWSGDWIAAVKEDGYVLVENDYYDRSTDSYETDKEDLDIKVEKKYYARPVDFDYFDYDNYFNEDDAEHRNMWFGGNRDFTELNSNLRHNIETALQDAYYDLFEVDEPDDPIDKTISYYFKKKSNKAFTEKEVLDLVELVRTFNNCSDRDENDLICKVLTILYDEEFTNGTICGCSQSDWMEYICPVSAEARLGYIKAVLFATGTEFEVSCEKLNDESELDDADTYYNYTEKYRDEDVLQWLADNIGCTKEEIEIVKE